MFSALLVGGAGAAEAASIGAGSLFQNGGRHLRFGAEEPTPRNELRLADGHFSGRGANRSLGGAPRGDVAVPEPGAALLFGLGVLAVARARRRA